MWLSHSFLDSDVSRIFGKYSSNETGVHSNIDQEENVWIKNQYWNFRDENNM